MSKSALVPLNMIRLRTKLYPGQDPQVQLLANADIPGALFAYHEGDAVISFHVDQAPDSADNPRAKRVAALLNPDRIATLTSGLPTMAQLLAAPESASA